MTENNKHTRRRFLQLSGGAAATAVLAGCTGNEGGAGASQGNDASKTNRQGMSASDIPMGGELIATLSADVKNFDPIQINDTTSSKAFSLVYEGLLGTDFKGKVHPVLATKVERKGERTYRATLRKGVRFHKDNGEVTAQDVKTSFERYKGTPRESDVYDWYKSSKIVDDHTIDIDLSRPYAPFETAVASVPIVPSEASGKKLTLKNDPIGTGPYQFVEHKPDSLFRIKRNDNYWFEGSDTVPATPPIKTITYRIIVEQSAQLAALQGGDVQLINDPPAPSISDLKSNGQYQVTGVIGGGFDMLIYPLASAPFDNMNVRRGVTKLIPRDAIVKSVYRGQAIPAYTPFAPLVDSYISDDVKKQAEQRSRYDEQAGTELLKKGFDEAGISKPFKTSLITNTNPQRVQWCQLIKESLNSTGYFQVSVQQFEWNTYLEKILSPNAYKQNNLVALGWSAGFDPDNYVNYLFNSDNFAPTCCNINHFDDKKVNSLIENGVKTYDKSRRGEIYSELTSVLTEQAPMAFIQFGKENDAMSNRVKNWRTYPINGGEYDPIYMPYADQVTWLGQ